MIGDIHDCEVIGVQKFQSTSCQAEVCEYNELAHRRPEQVIEGSPFELLQQRRSLAGVDLVEAYTGVRCIAMNYRELHPYGLPRERLYRFLDFHRVHWYFFLPHVEYLKIVIHAGVFDLVLVFLDLGVAIHFDAEVVAALLPVNFAVGDGKQIL